MSHYIFGGVALAMFGVFSWLGYWVVIKPLLKCGKQPVKRTSTSFSAQLAAMSQAGFKLSASMSQLAKSMITEGPLYPQKPDENGVVKVPSKYMGSVGNGNSGFAEHGYMEEEVEVALGVAQGYRWWKIEFGAGVKLSSDPAYWTDICVSGKAYLVGQNGQPWGAGGKEYAAECPNFRSHTPPGDACGCGFWAYWTPEAAGAYSGTRLLEVQGVIEGYGDVVMGDNGFRCQRLKIKALRPVINSFQADGAHFGVVKAMAAGLGAAFPEAKIYMKPSALIGDYGVDGSAPKRKTYKNGGE